MTTLHNAYQETDLTILIGMCSWMRKVGRDPLLLENEEMSLRRCGWILS